MDIRVKRYCRFILVRASVLNFERLNILRVTIGNLNKKLLLFEFAQSFCFQIRASWYITALNRTSELNVIVVWICYELQFWFWSISIYYVTQTDIRVKSYCRLNLLRTSVLNFELLNLTSELKVIVFLICLVLLFWISSVSIYYGTQSDIRVKSYYGLNLLRASGFNYERLNILLDSIGHPS